MTSVAQLNELLVTHNCLYAMNIELDVGEMAYDLSLSISTSEPPGGDIVRIIFSDICQLTSHDLGGGLTQLMHMSVKRLDSGFDRMRYQLVDLEDEKLSFYFSSFLIG